jgi:hypothetical protein
MRNSLIPPESSRLGNDGLPGKPQAPVAAAKYRHPVNPGEATD